MTQNFALARTNMVENQVRTNDVTDLDVQDAMRTAPREHLCPPGKAHLAYVETGFEYAPGWRVAEPRAIAKLLQAIYPRSGERVLAIAAPYAAMVLARAGCTVTAFQPTDGAPAFLTSALVGEGVTVETGDVLLPGELGPFDVIVCEGGVERAPKAWTDKLAEGGRLGVFEHHGAAGKGNLYLQGEDGQLSRREVFDAGVARMPGFAPARAFSL